MPHCSIRSYSRWITLFGAALATSASLAAHGAGVVDIADLGPGEVCFTSGNRSAEGGDCAGLVVAQITAAHRALLVQAYNFTERHIVAAIIAAHRRGVAVTVIVDKISAHQRGEGVTAVSAAGIAVLVDRKPRIAHSKVVVIDGRTVITGSFNFSAAAQCCNAENLLIVHSPALAAAYAANFARRQAVSEALGDDERWAASTDICRAPAPSRPRLRSSCRRSSRDRSAPPAGADRDRTARQP